MLGLFREKLVTEPTEDKCCLRCSSKFTAQKEKHICHQCRRAVCDSCSKNQIPIDDKPERCCDRCMEDISAKLDLRDSSQPPLPHSVFSTGSADAVNKLPSEEDPTDSTPPSLDIPKYEGFRMLAQSPDSGREISRDLHVTIIHDDDDNDHEHAPYPGWEKFVPLAGLALVVLIGSCIASLTTYQRAVLAVQFITLFLLCSTLLTVRLQACIGKHLLQSLLTKLSGLLGAVSLCMTIPAGFWQAGGAGQAYLILGLIVLFIWGMSTAPCCALWWERHVATWKKNGQPEVRERDDHYWYQPLAL
eukprot:gb/GEZN01006141.1/.p1 GENE.gb/GEZN01006141.1/~~gb/GEZN01006141.1/.p1  ORF type:complete len:303 (+),score=0.88 gb/GEZN01006141.1/:474-1382(+)